MTFWKSAKRGNTTPDRIGKPDFGRAFFIPKNLSERNHKTKIPSTQREDVCSPAQIYPGRMPGGWALPNPAGDRHPPSRKKLFDPKSKSGTAFSIPYRYFGVSRRARIMGV